MVSQLSYRLQLAHPKMSSFGLKEIDIQLQPLGEPRVAGECSRVFLDYSLPLTGHVVQVGPSLVLALGDQAVS